MDHNLEQGFLISGFLGEEVFFAICKSHHEKSGLAFAYAVYTSF